MIPNNEIERLLVVHGLLASHFEESGTRPSISRLAEKVIRAALTELWEIAQAEQRKQDAEYLARYVERNNPMGSDCEATMNGVIKLLAAAILGRITTK